jgi:Mrp family chromosome partitioning ATPase
VTKRLVSSAASSSLGRLLAPLLGRIRTTIARDAVAVLHITSSVKGEGVSTVSRELVKAAASLPACKPLLLDCNPGDDGQCAAMGDDLPRVVESYMASGKAEVAEIAAGQARFHAAEFGAAASQSVAFFPDGLDGEAQSEPYRPMERLYQSLCAGFNLIVVDCPPVREVPYFVPIAAGTPEVILVVRAEQTRIPTVLRAKDAVPQLGGRLIGVAMNSRRFYVPGFLYRRL